MNNCNIAKTLYKHKFFESYEVLVQWLNDNQIPRENIIAICPITISGVGEYCEYEVFFLEEQPNGKETI